MKRRAGAEKEQREDEEMTSLEVDLLILDYTAYVAIEASLNVISADKDEDGAERTLMIFNSFFAIFKKQRPAYVLDSQLRLRILLLKFLTLFMQRTNPNAALPTSAALLKLRSTNKNRAFAWIGIPGRVPSCVFDITVFDGQLPMQGTADVDMEAPEGTEDGYQRRVSLLDILPLFMQVSAASTTVIGSVLNKDWMNLAGEFMLQASLEQYLAFGASGSDAIDEAFSWGYRADAKTTKVDEGRDKSGANLQDCDEMFEDNKRQSEIPNWAGVRFGYLKKIFPDPGRNVEGEPHRLLLTDHLKDVAAHHPFAQFNTTLLSFLQALGKSIDDPVLVQLERGELRGMDKQQTQEFLEKCGVAGGGARFFDVPLGFKEA